MIISKQSAGSASEKNKRPMSLPQHAARCPTLSFTHEMVVDGRNIEGGVTYSAAFDSAMSCMQIKTIS